MAHKCEFCKEKIEEDERGKIVGTIIKVRKAKGEKNEYKYFCNKCQKEGKDKEIARK
ncbi:MAG: hypothetical protein AABW73_02025 [Nanoarchaeota archaeon]